RMFPVPEMNVGSLAGAEGAASYAFHALVSSCYGNLYAPRAAKVIVETSNTKSAQDFTKSMPTRPWAPPVSGPKLMLSMWQTPPPRLMSNAAERQRWRWICPLTPATRADESVKCARCSDVSKARVD